MIMMIIMIINTMSEPILLISPLQLLVAKYEHITQEEVTSPDVTKRGEKGTWLFPFCRLCTVSVKKHSFQASLCPAVLRQKLLSRPLIWCSERSSSHR